MNNGKSIKKIGKEDFNSYALISPSLVKTSKIKFKIGKISYTNIGVFDKDLIIKSNLNIYQ